MDSSEYDELSQDRDIVELIETVFSEEYQHGATEAAIATTPPIKSGAAGTQSSRRKCCEVPGCLSVSVSKRRCIRHGGGKRCIVESCSSGAKQNGVCWKHGGSRICDVEGCTKHSKSRGLCWSHGGGKTCASSGCDKTALRGGNCWAHGGGKRCRVQGCQRPAFERNGNLCEIHYAESNES